METIDWNACFEARRERMLSDLETLVRTESPTGDAEGIGEVAAWLARELRREGCSVETVDAEGSGPTLVARYGAGDRPVLLLGHTDTVWPRGTIERLPWRVDEGRAYGPGVFDMKSGCLVMLETIRGLSEHGIAPAVTVLLSADEEIGSPTARAVLEREAARSRAVLVLEPSLPGGLAKTSRSGIAAYRFTVHGRAAHAGVDPDKGVSAVVAAAELVTALHALNDLADGLSVNVGVIRGGTRANVVAAEASFAVDVRFRRMEQGHRVDAAIRALAPSNTAARVELAGGIDRPPLEPTAESARLFEFAAAAARATGFELGQGHVGGVSDGNLTAALGIPTLDGLGPDGRGAHADDEQVVVADLVRRPAMMARLLTALAC